MGHLPKRYIFVDYENLQKVKFSKLGKVCNKVFIFINAHEEKIPFDMVLQAQKMGKRVKWISAEENEDYGFDLHMSFLMGALHQKVDKNIEFAILSDNKTFDELVEFINETGRICLRVKTKKKKKEKFMEFSEEELKIPQLEDTDDLAHPIKDGKSPSL